MKKKRQTEEQIIGILREAEVPGAEIRSVIRKHNITEQTFYRWRNKYGGMEVSDARQLKALEIENASSRSRACGVPAAGRLAAGRWLPDPVRAR